MALQNPWVKYIDRTYEQIKANVLSNVKANVTEITDHTDSNPFIKGISIWSGISEMIGYYLDRKAREVYLGNAQKFSSGVKTAKLFDYRVKGVLAADVDLKFYIASAAPSNIIIPSGTIVATREGVVFRTLNSGTITTGSTQVIIAGRQWERISAVSIGTSNGAKSQVFVLEEGVVDSNIDITVNSLAYTSTESFAYVFSTDKAFYASLNESGEMTVEFGDNINGVIPLIGSSIIASYYLSLGELGNVGAETIVEIQSSVTVPSGVTLNVTNQLAATGGSNAESLQDLKKRIPLSIRTKGRAITTKDFIDIVKLVPGVSQSGVYFDCTSLKIFIAPNGGGVAGSTLLNTVHTYLEDKISIRELNTLQVYTAGQVIIQYVIDIRVRSDYPRLTVRDNVINNLIAFHNVENQEIGGSVALSDIYEVIELTTGVNSSNVVQMTPAPYARAIVNSTVLNWTRQILPASNTTLRWKITIISSTSIELIKGDAFMGQFLIDDQVTLPEVTFKVNPDTYTVGDAWEFYTYKYNGSITLEEQSIPFTSADYITVNPTGGYI